METLMKEKENISSPIIDGEELYYCSNNGIYKKSLNDKKTGIEIFQTEGVPSSICFSQGSEEKEIFVSDFFHKSILKYNFKKNRIEEICNQFEGKPFIGPNSVISDSKGNIYFTDSGPFGETNLFHPKGAIYMIEYEKMNNGAKPLSVLKPICATGLAYPSGLALDPSEKTIYVAEMMKNRILRGSQKPKGVWHFSTFFQFSGRIGPIRLVVDKNGNLYVAHYDFKENSKFGYILVLNSKGQLLKKIKCEGSEISGITIDKEGSGKKKFLYVTHDKEVIKLTVE